MELSDREPADWPSSPFSSSCWPPASVRSAPCSRGSPSSRPAARLAVSRTIKVLAAGGAAAGAAVAAAAVAANPALRGRGPPPAPSGPPPRGPVARCAGPAAAAARLRRRPARPGRGLRPGHRRRRRPSRRPPVLLLHGWTVSADLNFFAVYDELAARHRVIALDHRGHGRGMRPRTPFSLEDCADDAAALLGRARRRAGHRRRLLDGRADRHAPPPPPPRARGRHGVLRHRPGVEGDRPGAAACGGA